MDRVIPINPPKKLVCSGYNSIVLNITILHSFYSTHCTLTDIETNFEINPSISILFI